MARHVRIFHDEDLRITDLVTADNPRLTDVVFERCRLAGPAVLQPEQSTWTRNDYGAGSDPDTVLWTVSPWAGPVRGSIVARRCTFVDCVFDGVAFVGGSELTDELRTFIVESGRGTELVSAGAGATGSARVPDFRTR